MPFPKLLVDLSKLEDNTRKMLDDLNSFGIHVMGVNKVFNGDFPPAMALVRAGVDVVAEASLANLKKLQELPCRKALLRSPSLGEVAEAVQYADISLQSEVLTLQAMGQEAQRQDKPHQVLLMVDMGDLREGIWFEDEGALAKAVETVISSPALSFYGLGTNFNCYGTVMPSQKNGEDFVRIARKLEEKFKITFPYLSGGNCTSYHLLEKGIMPAGINELRIGSQHQFGIEYIDGKYLPGYHHSSKDVSLFASDLYILQGEIIELGSKPTVPVGELGKDAFMQSKTFVDGGWRRRAILNFGRQEIPYESIHPVDGGVTVLGQTSNHTLVDIQDAQGDYQLGKLIEFELDYTGLMFACNSPGITKEYRCHR